MGSKKLMRRISLLAALLAALALAASAESKTLFVIKGKGNGHGVGMSQWGAQGRALRNVGYGDILRFYYEPADVGDGGKNRVRVLLVSGRSSVTISSDSAFKVGRKTLQGDRAYSVVAAADGKVRVVGVGKFANPATASHGDDFLRLNGARYRGSFKLWARSGKMAVVNFVGMQGYLYSVVPREMPSWFEPAALRAQAVAARSYATRVRRESWFDLYATTSDQVYGGYESGEPASAVAAVDATAGKVVLHGGAVAQTFFSASNGGYEAASVDTWGGDLPYLQAKPDPDDLTPGNPHRTWVVLRTPARLANQLSLARDPGDAFVSDRASGRARAITAKRGTWSQTVTESPTTTAFGSEYFRAALGLKSGRFWLGAQALRASDTEIQCNDAVTLFVHAHDVGQVHLERRKATESSWTPISFRKIDDTHWRTTRHPCVSTDYRVVSPSARGPRIHVSVSASVAFRAVQDAAGLVGQVSPVATGSNVTVERRTRSGWTAVGQGMTADDGSFRVYFRVSEGVYRARVEPLSPTGLVTGVSPRLTVVIR
jgi:stage II sporulation protein D